MKAKEKTSGSYSDLWKAIIRPPRDDYTEASLGPKIQKCYGMVVERSDFELLNDRKHRLKCSHFQPHPSNRVCKQLPCIIYLHGNSSSRLEAFPYVHLFLVNNITLFTFDMSGSGLSEGKYISLGYYEKDDVKVVIDYLRTTNTVSTIGLWGRSMGAVTALLHVDRDPSIAGMVIDSPFTKLRTLGEELYKQYAKFPKIFMGLAIRLIKGSVKSRAKFDLDDLVPIDHVSKSFIPAMFIVATQDTFIDPHHGKELYQKYSGEKKLLEVEGDHFSERSDETNDEIGKFFIRALRIDEVIPKVIKPTIYSETQKIEVIKICPLTKQLIKQPYTTKCKHIFEKKALINYVSVYGKCPVCLMTIASDDLSQNVVGNQSHIAYKIPDRLTDPDKWELYVSTLSYDEQLKLALEESSNPTVQKPQLEDINVNK